MPRWIHIGSLALLFLLASCSGKPSPSAKHDPEPQGTAETSTPTTTAAPTEKSAQAELGPADSKRQGYRLEDEGTVAVSGDVVFEEDQLPPAPEDVGGEALQSEAVSAETIEDLPPVQGDASGGEDKIPPSVVSPVPPSVSGPVAPSKAAGVRGFRVQIGASTDRTGAEDLARVARTRTQDPVYVTLENPYYKVRVGDFQDRALALQLRDRLRANGYPEAWVVTTTVQPKDSGS